MLSTPVKMILTAVIIVMASSTLAGCGSDVVIPKDPWHGSAPIISQGDGNEVIAVPDVSIDSGMFVEPDYKGVPGDVAVPNEDIEYR